MTRTGYYYESLAPAWLHHDSGYRAALTQHMRDRMALQGFEIVSPIRIQQLLAAGGVPAPVGMVLLRIETEVEEFDVEVGEG
ncbi:hypothetical protein G3I39_25070 [Streptomyces fulvissimus]|uniref:Uncharacterized protein n=1 Tax=Streptomyces microflavus TaxID=1919 RepID=A0A6N9VJP3_STRMI|nr:hypothetical protein [Streptomyces microflavus]NEB70301.1 hypothetical protein [Streptomyces microflavus]NEE45580.1 hypothetical protein [Streptomyces sp. SID8455]